MALAIYTMLPQCHTIIFVDDDELSGRGICRRLSLIRAGCWDGNNRRDNDIDEFDVDDIDGQGMLNSDTIIIMQHLHSYTHSHVHGSGVWGQD